MPDISFPSHFDGRTTEIPGFLAEAKGGEKRGGILVIEEIFGVDAHIRDMTQRFADAGFDALAPELFAREGLPPASSGIEAFVAMAMGVSDRQITADLDAAAEYLLALPSANGKIGIIGFCYGGRVAMTYNAYARKIDAASAWYGKITLPPNEKQPNNPLGLVGQMQAPLQGHFGGKDQSVPVADARVLEKALKDAEKPSEIYIYEEAGHAFGNDRRPEHYHPESAEAAMARSLDWFRNYLD